MINCPSEGDFLFNDESDENDDVFENAVIVHAENNISSESETENPDSDLDERIYDPLSQFPEDSSDISDEENEWEEFDETRHKLKKKNDNKNMQYQLYIAAKKQSVIKTCNANNIL